MFGLSRPSAFEARGHTLASELRDQYGADALEVCRTALTRPGQSRERRRVIRLALSILSQSPTPGAARSAAEAHPDPA